VPVTFDRKYLLGGLQPAMDAREVDKVAVRIQPGLIALPQGAVLAESSLSQNAVHTLAATGATAGAFQLTWRGFTTAILPYTVTAAALQTALNGLGSMGAGGVVCAGGALNAAGITITWGAPNFGLLPIELPTITITTPFVTTALTLVSTTVGSSAGFYGPYLNGGANGLGSPELLNEYLLTTDQAGNITFGAQLGGEEFGQQRITAPAFTAGYFRFEDVPLAAIIGINGGFLDANAMASTSQFARTVQGSVALGVGIFRLL
jgi:hypothetical protein